MFSDQIGVRRDEDDRELLHTRGGEVGHAIYGPYRHTQPGAYRVDFDLALLARLGPDDAVCAVVDVTANEGKASLARRAVHVDELSPTPGTVSLTFTLREFRSLEFRVFVEGTAELLVGGSPRITRLSDPVGEERAADPGEDTTDPVELARQVRAVLRLLRPQRAKGFRKVRLGNISDGGYVCIDDFDGLDTALSFGINDDITWDKAIAGHGLRVFQFDHTVDDPDPQDDRMIFAKKMIAPTRGPGSESISALVAEHDRTGLRPNMMLKMDIEGHEWSALEATSAQELGRFAQIVCELHYFQGLDQVEWRRRIHAGLAKLHQHHAVIHVHANICGGISNLGNVIFPNVLEVSFANRDLYAFEDTDELFPGALDVSCDADQPDMFLGAFRF